jgi:ABC-type multidrug transport system ATPase subunit
MGATRLANRVLVIQNGRVIRDGRPDMLLPQLTKTSIRKPADLGNVDVV